MRYKLTISYNGALFFGSQSQKNTSQTVLGKFEGVLKKLQINSKIVASGRTDRGVHATGQVIHFDVPDFWNDKKRLHTILNQKLPPSIRVKKVELVNDEFHARYSASRRVYRYVLCEGEANPFEYDFITFHKKIDLELLENSIKLFEGKHNFEMFKKSGSPTTNFVRTIYKTSAYRHKEKVVLHFEADGYLRSQIRLMVGFLLQINDKILDETQLQDQLSNVTQHSTFIAPCNGLYLAKIKYPLH
ncbi:MAG: tRNA pseudouridine(38-40) synthase TruA [Helicobacteraceae bacterium]|nr:tRNA pseudouridine(38-40) synthase TruA [Helicobacteraceae bacterium]